MTVPPAPNPGPAPGRSRIPIPVREVITSDQLRDWIERRRRLRRKVVAVAVTLAALGIGGLVVVWSAFQSHLLAMAHLRGLGFAVDWEIGPDNFWSGGKTDVSYRPSYYFQEKRVTGRDLESLKSLRHLRSLTLTGADQVPEADFSAIAGLGELEELELDRSPSPYPAGALRVLLTDRVLDHVRGLTKLKTLGLAGNRITDAGLAKLANLQALDTLDLDGTAVTDAGLDALVGLKGLKLLRIERTRVTREGIARFQQRRPDVEVIHEALPMDLGVSGP